MVMPSAGTAPPSGVLTFVPNDVGEENMSATEWRAPGNEPCRYAAAIRSDAFPAIMLVAA